MLHAGPGRLRRSLAPAAKSVAVSEIALTGVYEISKILTSAHRLETTLSNVVNLLASFMQMRHGVIVLLDHDGIPDIVVGAGWSEESSERYRERMPKKAIGQVIATAMPFVVPNVAAHPLFEPADIVALGAENGTTVSFIGVPIRIGFKVVGTLTIDRALDPHSAFRLDFDVRFLVMIANLIGQTVELHRMLARDRERLIAESHRLQKQLAELKPEFGKVPVAGILGDSKPMRSLLEKIRWSSRGRARRCCCAARVGHRQGADRPRDPRLLARARRARSSRSTALPCPTRCSSRSCSATRRAPSPAPSRPARAASNWPTAARCSSTRSAKCRRRVPGQAVAGPAGARVRAGGRQSRPSRSNVRLVTATNRKSRGRRWRRRSSAKTSITASMWWR